MAMFEVRVWLPDRPGALGDVASRVGVAGGDVVGIEILERGGGAAVDELLVELPATVPPDRLAVAISTAPGVAVEDVRPVVSSLGDPQAELLEAVATLLDAGTEGELLASAIELVAAGTGADWVAVVDLDLGVAELRAGLGEVPHPAWLTAFLAGARSSFPPAAGDTASGGVSWAPVPGSSLHLLLGRPGRPLRQRERRRLRALAGIVGLRRSEIAYRASVSVHPSNRTALSIGAG